MAEPTNYAAWYGAVVSTMAFGLASYVAWRDRVRLRIHVTPNMMAIDPAGLYEENKLYFMVSVANRGRRSVTIHSVGFLQQGRGSGTILLSDSFSRGSREIAEGKAEQFYSEQERLPLHRLRAVVVFDATGRRWKKRIPRSVRLMAKKAPDD